MSPELLAYPFLFIAIFFESFVLVTLLSKPARLARLRRAGGRAKAHTLPTVTVIVPCYNEATTVAATCDSLLALDYPKGKLEIILVDDGSTDSTPAAMARFEGNPQIHIIKKENGGKHTALNAGIAATQAEIVGCLDADSFVESDALREIVPCFMDTKVAAVTAAMSVHDPKNLIQHMQNAEYIFGIAYRHAFASINGLYVTPGPFSFYRRDVIETLGGFRHGHQTEDMEMALRIQQAGYGIENAPRARVYTTTPLTISKLIRQRTRWTTGFLRNVLGEYRGLIGSRSNHALGMLVLPSSVIAVGSGILIFLVTLFNLAHYAITTFQIRVGMPLSYALTPQSSIDWFYFPSNFLLFFAAAIFAISFGIIAIGKHISKTPGNLAIGIVTYALIYGLVVPLWLIRATSDVALGVQRVWK